MAQVPRVWREAAERWGYLAEGQAHRYGLPNGATLLARIASGESGFNQGAVSSAGARGGTQFMPGTRYSFILKYRVDPWKSPDEAMHAAGLFMRDQGLDAYNPGGGQSYIDYILHQPVSIGQQARRGAGRAQPSPSSRRSPAPPAQGSSGFGGELIHIGLTGLLVLGGAGLVGLGVTRMMGSAAAGRA